MNLNKLFKQLDKEIQLNNVGFNGHCNNVVAVISDYKSVRFSGNNLPLNLTKKARAILKALVKEGDGRLIKKASEWEDKHHPLPF